MLGLTRIVTALNAKFQLGDGLSSQRWGVGQASEMQLSL